MISKKEGRQFEEFMEELASIDGFFTDSHAHIHFPPLSEELEDVVKRAAECRVERIVTIGIDLEDSRRAVKVAHDFENVFAAVGVHPHDAEGFKTSMLHEFEAMLRSDKVIALGEIGLDFYRNHSPQERQEDVFAILLDLAVAEEKPVIIHNRDATSRCMDVMDPIIGSRERNGIIHCFNGDKDFLRWALDNGFYISYAGPVTYKKSDDLRETLKYVPAERLFIETDCPYLAPMPYRGKTNEPARTVFTAETVCAEKGLSLQELAHRLEENFRTLFGDI